MMKNKLVILYILFELCPILMIGQERWWNNDKILYNRLLLENSALINDYKSRDFIEAGFYLNYAKKSPKRLISIAAKTLDYSMATEGLKKIKDLTVYAKAYYTRSTEYGLSHSLTKDSHIFYPFIVADSIAKDNHTESYYMQSSIAYKLSNKINIGISLSYKGEIRYSRKDPRVLNNISSINSQISASYHTKLGLFYFDIHNQTYRQAMSYALYENYSSQKIFVLRPFGAYNLRYSVLSSSSDSYYHDFDRYGISLSYLLDKYNLYIGNKFSYLSAKLKSLEAGLYPNEKISLEYNNKLISDIYYFNKESKLFIVNDLYYEYIKGIERIYRQVKAEDRNFYHYEFVTASTSFSGYKLKNELSLNLLLKKRKSHYQGYLSYIADYANSQSFDEILYNKKQLSFIRLGINIKKKYNSNIALNTNISYSYKTRHEAQQKTAESIVNQIDVSRFLYSLNADNIVNLSNTLYISLSKENEYLALRLNLDLGIWDKIYMHKAYTYTINTSISYNF